MTEKKPDLWEDKTLPTRQRFNEALNRLKKAIEQGASDEEQAKIRKTLGSLAWDLRFHDNPVSEKTLKEYKIVPTMGKVIPRGQSGKDR